MYGKSLLFVLSFATIEANAQGYTKWVTGDPADFVGNTHQGGIVLAGGGPDNDQAMAWMLQRAGGGDVVVLRASGSNGYNNYFFSELGVTVHSVETIRFDAAGAAYDPYVVQQIRNAEVLFIAGGDQYKYYQYWKDTPVEDAINYLLNEKGITVGGTSAGMAILGRAYYAPPGASLQSTQALANPFHLNTEILGNNDFLHAPFLQNLITDTHYDQRERHGRHVVFMARLADAFGQRFYGIACNEATAVCISPDGTAKVFGEHPAYPDYAYFLKSNCQEPFEPETCANGQPLTWYRQKRAIIAYKAAGTLSGTAVFSLNDWESASGGEWQDWYVENGALTEVTDTDSDCGLTTSLLPSVGGEQCPLRVFPNPASDFFHVRACRTALRAYLFDTNGTLVWSVNTPSTGSMEVPCGNLPAGVYTFQAVHAGGAERVRVVKR